MDSGIRARVGRAPKVSNLQKPRPLRTTLKNISEECNNNNVELNINDVKNQNLSSEDLEENYKTLSSLCMINNNADEETMSNTIPEQTVPTTARKRAPRGLKLTKPPPRKSSQNKSIEDLEKDVLDYIERLLLKTFTTEICVKFREFLLSHGSELEKSNKGLMDNCFACVKEYLNSGTRDSCVEIDLKDMILLRKQNWESAVTTSSPKEEGTCDLMEIVNMKLDTIRNDENANFILTGVDSGPQVATQQSVDSGYGEMDEVLWDCEEEFFKDLQQHRLEETTMEKEVYFGEKENVMTDIENGNTCMLQHNLDSRAYRSKSEEKHINSNNLSRNYNRPYGSEGSRLSSKQELKFGSVMREKQYKEGSEDWETDMILDVKPPTCFQRSVSVEEGLKKITDDVPSRRNSGGFGSPQLQEEKNGVRHCEGFSRSLSLEEKPKSLKERFTGLTSKNMLIRQPITPGMSEDKIQDIEKTLPRGIYTAGGRRRMFKCYSDAMREEDTIENCGDDTYTRMEILCLSESLLSKKVPSEWSYLSLVFPEVCVTQVNEYFNKDEYLQKTDSEQKTSFGQRAGFGQKTDSVQNRGFGQRAGFGQRTDSEQKTGFGQRVGFGQKTDSEQKTSFGQKSDFGQKPSFGLIRKTIELNV